MASQTGRTLVVLGAVLTAVVVVSVIAVALVTGPRSETRPATTTTALDFDLSPLQRSEYVQLNRQLILEGVLPVEPPPVVGKTIPFL